jgi:hypothetical protein
MSEGSSGDGSGYSSGSDPAGSSSGGTTGTPGSQPQAGQLTAGIWDDNLNFDFFKSYLATTSALPGAPVFTAAERSSAHDASLVAPGSRDELDLAFVIDTTGSMGDELSYLQTEVESIVSDVRTKFPSLTPRLGLVLYRDRGDAYLTRDFEFTSDLAAFKANLAAQSAGGGGDLPEAVAQGLGHTASLGWRTGSVARMAFWIGDAPAHVEEASDVRASIDALVQKSVHVYPVASSGVDGLAEYTMRSVAQFTGGRYVFLTDDSGIGNSHAEPHIPCYVVTRFDQAIVRLVESELSGKRVEPASSDVLRTVGNPAAGKCSLTDDSEVILY